MATINLGSIKFNWKGSYSGATAYVVDDVVESSGSSYICIAATTGNAPPNATYWEQMSSAGTDGTDLTSTLTTQGDIVYRDASGLARLGAGTAGQVLQTGGAGANPSWTAVSSDYVRISTTTISSAVSGIDIDNIFSTSYENYVIIGNDLRSSVQDDYVRMRFLDSSGTQISGANYRGGTAGYEGTTQAQVPNNSQVQATFDSDLFLLKPAGNSVDNTRCGFNFTMNLPKPYDNDYTQAYGMYGNTRPDNRICFGNFYMFYNAQIISRGVKFDFNGGNLTSGKITVYGIKTS